MFEDAMAGPDYLAGESPILTPNTYTPIVEPPAQGYTIPMQEAWLSQYDQGQHGATAFPPIHLRSNPTEDDLEDYSAPTIWWKKRTGIEKALIIGGSAALVGGIAYYFLKK
jgi:hypothetical protein